MSLRSCVLGILFGLSLIGCNEAPKRKSRGHRSAADATAHLSPCEIVPYKAPPSALHLSGDPGLSRRLEAIRAELPEGLDVNAASTNSMVDGQGHYHIPLQFQWEGESLCSWQYFATAHDRGDSIWIKGQIPREDLLARGTAGSVPGSPKRDALQDDVASLLAHAVKNMSWQESGSCLMEQDGQLHQAMQLTLDIDGQPYDAAWVDGEVAYLSPAFLHAAGRFNVYSGGSNLSNSIQEIVIDGLQDSGYLCSSYLTVSTDQRELSYRPDFDFKFEPADKRFREAAVFANASDMMQWFLAMDKDAHWSGAQVELFVSDERAYEESGPFYSNPSFTSALRRPRITIPDKMAFASQPERPLLQNLTTDFDVVAHELSHHIVSKYVGLANQPENILVHEGLADFFVHAKTGSSCLARSICSEDSPLCEIPGRCLRSSEIVLNINDPTYQGLPIHNKSALVSGMLWELGSGPLGLASTAKLVMQGLHYLNKTTDVTDLLLAVLQADRDLFQGANACAIRAVAERRGLGPAVADVGPCPAAQAP